MQSRSRLPRKKLISLISEFGEKGASPAELSNRTGISRTVLKAAMYKAAQAGELKNHDGVYYSPSQRITTVISNKKIGSVNWRDHARHAMGKRELHQKASWSNDDGQIKIDIPKDNIIVQPLGDLHFGSIASDMKALVEITDAIVNDPRIYVILLGDLTDNFVSFKNQLAVHQQIMSPSEQDDFLESWLNEIKDKVLFATWCNHSEFEERASGKNSVKKILSRSVMYFNGMAKIELDLNGIVYKIAATHKTRFNSSFNATHGLKQLARKDFPDCDIYLAGDTHWPAMERAFERNIDQLFIKIGTFKLDDGYSKRYFSRYTSSVMPCFVLNTKQKDVCGFWKLDQALKYVGKK